MDEPLYVIAWESRITGMAGRGEQAVAYAAAREHCRMLNREHAAICHWPELADVYRGVKEVPHEQAD